MREANKALIGEMSQSLVEAGKRFTETSREMRQAAQDLQRELTATREELKRGVLDLPEEARESAEAMRRVVGDQIKALTELSEIVTRHGKTLDVSSPALGEPRAPRSTERPPIAVGESRQRARGPGVAPTPPGAAAWHASPAPRGARSRAPRRAPPRRAPAAAGRPASARRSSRTATTRKGGYPISCAARPMRTAGPHRNRQRPMAPVPPTARRRSDGAAEPPQVPATRGGTPSALNAFSGDIARAIDHNAAVELWERHSRGEKNLFTRRLYTLQGQQTFDEIRRKYQRDTGLPRRGRPLRGGLREAPRRGHQERPRAHGRQRLPHLGHGQGLHDACPRQRPVRLEV